MRKPLAVSSVVVASLLATSAFAATAAMSDVSTIKALDKAHHSITLADGKMFTVPAAWKFSGHKVGDKVKVTYETKDGKMWAKNVVKTM